ncbi:transposase [Desulfomonile tiedjei]|uniref:Transposase n=1 Tax=Desulfomonile tiedjei (strain ATCC 49306 / DSM 6799 / DCB-1) TaxID=706587 RepID=I4C4B6_DESTA|nr:transposase [Desulfomonile tiedjei]AFM24407.1 transposase [Desulfomonile tiedjei DSM 6799]
MDRNIQGTPGATDTLQCWYRIASKLLRNTIESKFSYIETDAYVIMPNHFHGIIVIVGADRRVCPILGAHEGAHLPKIIQWFKTMTTNEYIRHAKKNRLSEAKLWQRNYYEHVIRNEKALHAIRTYIEANPGQWPKDPENPNYRQNAEVR